MLKRTFIKGKHKFLTKRATQVYVLLRNKSKSCDITLQANHQVDELECKSM